jgi:phospholipid/cholesterol/gamma-HCH transport system ATP-binding protein
VSADVTIACRGLKKSFGNHVVLEDLDLEVLRGETLVILGHSGTGKSVLLKHMNALLAPDEGSVLFEGRDITKVREAELATVRRKIGMLFQGAALFDSLTVEENVAFALDYHGICKGSERERRVAELLEDVGLEGTQKKMPADLSGGMRKRAALARSLALEPDVSLYDEPTTGLDPVTGRQINELILHCQTRLHVTSVVVTHDLASAYFVADRIAFLYDHKIYRVGSVEMMRSSGDPVIEEFLSAASLQPR